MKWQTNFSITDKGSGIKGLQNLFIGFMGKTFSLTQRFGN